MMHEDKNTRFDDTKRAENHGSKKVEEILKILNGEEIGNTRSILATCERAVLTYQKSVKFSIK